MLNYIICEDDVTYANFLHQLVYNFMMNYDIEHNIIKFDGYTNEFKRFAKEENGFKIYFLDIKTKIGSGLDAARMIREEFDDWVSIIVMVTGFSEYRYEALSNRLYLLDFVNKLDNSEKRLKDDLIRSLKNYDNRYKTLTYEYNHVINRIEFRQIIYIEKEQDSKRCLIKTTYGEHIIPKNLNEVLKMLDKRFIKVHRSLIINVDHMKEYILKENKLIYSNGEHTYLISRSKKKELLNYVGNNS